MKLREWQQNCLDAFIERRNNGRDLFVFEACPGAGKSLMAAELAWQMLNDEVNQIDFVLVVVPWKSIQGDMASGMIGTFDRRGLRVRERLMIRGARIVRQPVPVNLDSVITTYAEAMSEEAVDTIKMWTSQGLRIAVILDEIHHANEMNGSWGTHAASINELSQMTVVMSGTFFRTDGLPIKFVNYTDDGRPVLDCPAYKYAEAVKDRVCRAVTFKYTDVDVKLVHETKGVSTSNLFEFGESDSRLGKVMREVFHPEGECVRKVIMDTDEHMTRLRKRFHNAGALFCCRPGRNSESEDKHVHQIAQKIRQYTGNEVVVVTHSDSNAQGKIEAFRNGSTPYLVAVDMITEGVDIPRLRAIGLLRYIRSEMMFRQIIGRAIRMTDDEDGTAAEIFLPKFKLMYDFATNMEFESLEGLKDLLCNVCGQYPCVCICQQCNSDPCICRRPPPPPGKDFEVLEATPFSAGGSVSDTEVQEAMLVIARAVMQRSVQLNHANDVQLAYALQLGFPMMMNHPTPSDTEQSSHLKSLTNARNRVNRLMQKLAGKKYAGDFQACWVEELMKPFKVNWTTVKNTWTVVEIERLANRLEEKLVEAFTNENR